nr:alpha/beta fold hydrolase [Nannocystis pusilla]
MVGQVRVDRRPGPDGGTAPPLVILGGMTQTLSSWGGQVRPLSGQRPVIVYEARGQGQTRLDLRDVTPPVHVEDFERLLDALGVAGQVDLCGFSFGGRIALAIAAERPERVRRLVLSGVSAGRGALGRVIVRAWREALRTGDLEALAWISLGDTLGPRYLEANEAVLEAFVKATVQRNTYAGISALFTQTLDDGADSPWAPLQRRRGCRRRRCCWPGRSTAWRPPASSTRWRRPSRPGPAPRCCPTSATPSPSRRPSAGARSCSSSWPETHGMKDMFLEAL